MKTDANPKQPLLTPQQRDMAEVKNFQYFYFCFFCMYLPFLAWGLYIIFGASLCSAVRKSVFCKWAEGTIWLDFCIAVLVVIQYISFIFMIKAEETKLNGTNKLQTPDLPPATSTYKAPEIQFQREESFTPVNVKPELPRFAVCHHSNSKFIVNFFASQPDAVVYYNFAQGSKILTNGTQCQRKDCSRDVWEITLRQYLNLYIQRERLRLKNPTLIPLPNLGDLWIVCNHNGSAGFWLQVYSNEIQARDRFDTLSSWTSRLISNGNVIMEDYHMTDNWKQALYQYWELYLDFYQRERQQSPGSLQYMNGAV